MVLAFFILGGFQRTIKDKIYNLKGHVEVAKFSLGSEFDEDPIAISPRLINTIEGTGLTDHYQFFAHKAGMIKTDTEIEGILLKGVSRNFSLDRFKANMSEGRFIEFYDSTYAKEIVLSDWMANRLSISVGDTVLVYFYQDPPRVRNLEVVGLYNTGLEEIDHSLALGDLSLVRRLNNWPDTLVGGVEVFANQHENIDLLDVQLYDKLDASLISQKVSHKYGQIFDWLDLLDQNVRVFLVLILIVACLNMISILIILIMERTNMIGLLMALGADTLLIKKIFKNNGRLLVFKGLLFGNVAALGIAWVQDMFHLIPLDQENYYMEYVPIHWDVQALVLVNVLTFLVVSLSLSVPLRIISRISPVKAVKFD